MTNCLENEHHEGEFTPQLCALECELHKQRNTLLKKRGLEPRKIGFGQGATPFAKLESNSLCL
jgi:hypothetical protein